MKYNLKTVYEGWAKAQDKCKNFQYNIEDVSCFTCNYSSHCQFLFNFKKELEEMLRETERVLDMSEEDLGKSYILREILGE